MSNYAEWDQKYSEKFGEAPPLLYMQGFSDEEKIALLKKAIERGSPLDEDKDFGPPLPKGTIVF